MKILTFILLAYVVIGGCAVAAHGQNASVKKSASVEVTSEREQDGLNGAVRRVRVETAKIAVKNGQLTEEPRVVREITTYDPRGKRVDTVAHPVEPNRPSGKEQYRYDEKGNIIEMILRAEDGSILGREIYEYEFDGLGNWRKMTTSIGIYEDGKLGFEPIEVTYRTIAYYYNQAVEKIISAPDTLPASAAINNSAAAARISGPPPSIPTGAPGDQPAPGAEQNGVASQAAGNPSVPEASSKPEDTKTVNTIVVKTGEAAPPLETAAPRKVASRHVSEDVLRAAAVHLPQPEFPSWAQFSGQQLRLEVQVVVNESGEVTSARGTGPEGLINAAAEAAALKARFSPAKLSVEPSQVFGVISYELSPASNAIAQTTPSANAEKKDESQSGLSERQFISAPPKLAAAPALEATGSLNVDATSIYKQGVAYLSKGQYAEAVEALKSFVYRNPESAEGYSKLGFAYCGLHKYEEAVVVLKLAIKIRPDMVNALTYYQLGQAYDGLKKYNEALKAFKKSLEVIRAQSIETDQTIDQASPSPAMVHYSLGLEQYYLGRYNEAVKSIKQAISLNPRITEPYYALAMAYLSLGDRISAEKQEAILRSLNPALAKKVAAEIASRTLFIPPGCLALPCP